MHTPTRRIREEPENPEAFQNVSTHKKHEQYPFQAETTNRHDYRPYQISLSPVSNRRRPQNREAKSPERHFEKDVLQTTYKMSYSPHCHEKKERDASPRGRRKEEEYRPSPFKLDTETEYRAKYLKKEVMPQNNTSSSFYRNYKPEYRPNTAKFQGQTTYRVSYSPSPVKNQGSHNRRETSPSRVSPARRLIPFDANTTYKNDFTPPKTQSYNRSSPEYSRVSAYSPNKAKFQGETSYKADYVPIEIPHRRESPFNRRSPGKINRHNAAPRYTYS